ncbi:hypothetical protein RN001_001693 [Aquatica leii]|uniref:Activating signal cointegrator 1 n=1 Tax=Aquatica leii TaxID=1421715 RepID=A0AAN7SJP3_9COLE|nr:hypothetical protein RN001_001693 [Aquatica leii]
MEDFIKNCLKPILKTDVDDEIIQYIKDIKVVEDFDEFIANIIDTGNPQHVEIYEKLKNKLFSDKKGPIKAATKPFSKTNKNVQQDKDNQHKKTNGRNQTDLSITSKNTNKLKVQHKGNQSSSKKGQVQQQSNKKFKNINLETYDFKRTSKEGRQPCNCEARTHSLINNCLKCGRIVCEQEGSGPCFFCDTLVCTNEELHILATNSKLSDKLHNHLFEQKTSKEWKKAIETRDRLIKADKSSEDKRKIYDDQSEYYKVDRWNNRQMEIPKLHKSMKDMKLALDFATQKVISSEVEHNKQKESLMSAVNSHLDATERRFAESERVRLWDEIVSKVYCDKKQPYTATPFSKVKVANDAFLEEIDRGMCISMHQPWASLLVAGIKVHEGRTWYTDHRGRLWIHAASKHPENEQLLEVEQMYRDIYNNPSLEFPKNYPTSCLLGCVFVEDCLSQEQYRGLYATGESDSPYVLICSKPMILPIFHSMQGQHKIFPLSKEMHNIARDSLMSSKWI